MKIRILFFCLALFLLACSSSKRTAVVTTKAAAKKAVHLPVSTVEVPVYTSVTAPSSKIRDIIDTAFSYDGTPYKYGGTTRSGMDCSGLVYTAFTTNGISLQRSSYLIATQGTRIQLSQVRPGDLVFFTTYKEKKRINHVGLVTESNETDIKFIHATTSRGVIVSSINEHYWKNTFVEARKIL